MDEIRNRQRTAVQRTLDNFCAKNGWPPTKIRTAEESGRPDNQIPTQCPKCGKPLKIDHDTINYQKPVNPSPGQLMFIPDVIAIETRTCPNETCDITFRTACF